MESIEGEGAVVSKDPGVAASQSIRIAYVKEDARVIGCPFRHLRPNTIILRAAPLPLAL